MNASDWPNPVDIGSLPGLWSMSLLKALPVVEIGSESAESGGSCPIRYTELFYDIPDSEEGAIRIFARYARPSQAPSMGLPGLVWVHGGASIGSDDAVVHWASRGFAAISMDLPGRGGEARATSRSEGPDMSDQRIFTVTPSPRCSYLYLCVNAVCRAISLLSSRPEVDPSRIGVLGYSWGGVIALLANGVDDRVRAACTVYGAGFIHEEGIWVEPWVRNMPEDEARTWTRCFDPSSYLASQHGPTLFVSATADAYYPMRSFIRTWRDARCGKALSLALNRNHDLDEPCAAAVARWFERMLGSGPPLPRASVTRQGGRIVIRTSDDCPVASVHLSAADSADFRSAKWRDAELAGSGGAWNAEPPGADVPYIITIVDETGAAFTVFVHIPGMLSADCSPAKGDRAC